MPELPSYANRLRAKARRETTRFIQHKLLTGACVATAAVIVRLALWHFNRLTLTWADVWINLLIIGGSFAIVALVAFAVNLFRATALLDQAREDEITAVTAKLKIAEAAQLQKQTTVRFAALFEDGKATEEKMIVNQSAHEFNPLTEQITEWIERVEHSLIEAGLPTDASIFVHSGERISQEQTKALVPSYLSPQTWKHYDIARISIYLSKLQEIMERRGL
jgi:hypothetical protein